MRFRSENTLLSVNTPLAIFAGTAAPRIGLALSALHVAAAQTAPQGFLYKHLQSFGPEAKFTPQTRKQRLPLAAQSGRTGHLGRRSRRCPAWARSSIAPGNGDTARGRVLS